jgi:hypothetical protein
VFGEVWTHMDPQRTISRQRNMFKQKALASDRPTIRHIFVSYACTNKISKYVASPDHETTHVTRTADHSRPEATKAEPSTYTANINPALPISAPGIGSWPVDARYLNQYPSGSYRSIMDHVGMPKFGPEPRFEPRT